MPFTLLLFIFLVYFKFSPLLLLFCIVNIHLYLSPYLPLSATLYFFLNFMFLFRIVFFLPEEFPLVIVLGKSTGDEFFSFCLSENISILPSFLKNIFMNYIILVWHFVFGTIKISFYYLLAAIFSVKNSAQSYFYFFENNEAVLSGYL